MARTPPFGNCLNVSFNGYGIHENVIYYDLQLHEFARQASGETNSDYDVPF